MKKLLFLSLLISSFCSAQKEKVISVAASPWGHTYQALLHLPDTSEALPLVLFLHGKGEAVNNLSAIYNNANAGGPSYYIERDQFPHNMMVVSPQAAGTGWSATADNIDAMLKDLVKRYKVDTTRIYLTGLSAGGDGALKYILGNYRYKPAAVVLMSQAGGEINGMGAQIIVNNGVRVWVFAGTSDPLFPNTRAIVDRMNEIKPGALSTYYSGGHCCWGTYYNPSWKQDGKNIYEWMLQYSTAPVIVTPPVVVPPVKVIASRVFVAGWEFVLYNDGTSESKK